MSASAEISKFSSGRGCFVRFLDERFFLRSFFVGSSVNHSIKNTAYWFKFVAPKLLKSSSSGFIFLFESTYSWGDSLVTKFLPTCLVFLLLGVLIADVTGWTPFNDLWSGVWGLQLVPVRFLFWSLNGFVTLFSNCFSKFISEWRQGLSFNCLSSCGVCRNSLKILSQNKIQRKYQAETTGSLIKETHVQSPAKR